MEDTTEPAPFRLMDLPNELIRAICFDDDMDGEDLKSLRLTNKHISEFASDSFAEFYLESFSVIMTRSSIQALIDISKHPRFGRCIHTVNISPVRAFSEGLTTLVQNLTPVLMGPDQDKQKVDASHKDICFYTSRYHAERELRMSGDAQQMQDTAFEELARRDQHLELAFDVDEYNAIGARGCLYNRDFDELKNEDKIWALHWRETIETTIKAIYDSGCKIRDLSIQGEEQGSHRCESNFCTDGIAAELVTVCRELESISISFGYSGLETTSLSIKRILSAATHLKRLDFGSVSETVDLTGHTAFLNCIQSTTIESVCLALSLVKQQDLVRFLSKHKDTIRSLSLSSVWLRGSWAPLLTWFRDHLPELEYLAMDGITDIAFVLEKDWHKTAFVTVLEGGNMKARINEVLENERQREIKEAEAKKENEEVTTNNG